MPLLPKDLQRFAIDGPNATPQYIKPTPAVVQLVRQILDCFRFSPDDSYGALCSTLEPLCLQSQRHRLIKGFIHILESRLVFNEDAAVDPVLLREKLFTMAAEIPASEFVKMNWRDKIVDLAAKEFGFSPNQIDSLMYGDLKSERQILSFDDIEEEPLIAEYNLTLAKSMLLYARKLTFTVELGDASSQSMRRLFQSLKFFNLLFDAQPVTDTIWQFEVDGPSAVLPQPQKYATSLASFLPMLYTFSAWHATSELEIDGKHVSWQLKPDDFEAPVQVIPERIPDETVHLMERIPQISKEWVVTRDHPILQFGPQAVWIPDFSIRNVVTEKVAHVEVLGYWRADYLNRRLKLLSKAPGNLILVLSDKLQIDKAVLENSRISILTYKRTPVPSTLIELAVKCAKTERMEKLATSDTIQHPEKPEKKTSSKKSKSSEPPKSPSEMDTTETTKSVTRKGSRSRQKTLDIAASEIEKKTEKAEKKKSLSRSKSKPSAP
ncbi:MAG: DUF790 family protein [Proteobacteria bacterium]|nr:DUF790 family protein [Pseudomonadota bacterium]